MDRQKRALYYIWLSGIPGIGVVTANRLLGLFGTAWEVYRADKEALLASGIGRARAASILQNRNMEDAGRILEECLKKEIGFIIPGDSFFTRFGDLGADAPVLLYTKGVVRCVRHTAGIVGPRRCTQEAKRLTAETALQYTQKRYAIVSGMAKGTDSYAHTACVNAGGYTIAVLGNGLDICYPKEHAQLMEAIAGAGLLVSEYAPGIKPSAYHFPQRNRLIAALSDELIVVEPGVKSGSGITRDYAGALGRPVRVFRCR